MIVFVLAFLLLLIAGAALWFCRIRGLRGAWLLPSAATLAVCWIWMNACGLFNSTYDRWLNVDKWPSQPLALLTPTTSSLSPLTPLRPIHASPDATQPASGPAHTGRTAIIVLGGGTEHTGPHRQLRPEGDSIEKVALAAHAYQTFVAHAPHGAAAPLVIVSGGDPEHHGGAEADTYVPELAALGVPSADLIAENRSLNTYQNAEFVRPLLEDRHIDRLILLTTAMHMRRAMLDFTRFGMQVEPLAPAIKPGRITFWPDVENLKRAGAELHEIVGIQQFHVYRALGRF